MIRLAFTLLLIAGCANAQGVIPVGLGGTGGGSAGSALRALGDLDITIDRLNIGGSSCGGTCPDWEQTGVQAQSGNSNVWGEPLDTSGWTIDTTTLAACAGTDDRTLIQNAVTNAAAQTVLVIPVSTTCKVPDEGSYLRIARDEIVIRGASRATSILDLGNDTDDAGNATVCNNGASKETRLGICGTGGTGVTTTLSSGYTRGSTSITASSAGHGLIAGDYAVVWTLCPASGPAATGRCDEIHTNYKDVVERQVVKVAGVSGADITLTYPLNIDFTAANVPRIQKTSLRHSIGIENLTLNKGSDTVSTKAGDGTPPSMVIYHARDTWFKNVTFTNNYRGFLLLFQSFGITIRGNEFGNMACETAGDCDYAGHYGIVVTEGTTAWRIESNWIHHEWLWAKIDQAANLGVIAYNYVDSTNDCAGSPANHGLLFHGAFPTDVLIEGNDTRCRVTLDNRWGVEGDRITFHRNRLSTDGTAGVVRVHKDNDCGSASNPNIVDGPLNLINNTVYAFTSMPYCGEYTGGTCERFDNDTCTPDVWAEFNAARDGATSPGTDAGRGFTVGADSGSVCDAAAGDCTESPANQWGDNWEGITAPNSALTSATLPGSLYYEAEPTWWCDESGTFGASIGANVDDFGGTLSEIPARRLADGDACT